MSELGAKSFSQSRILKSSMCNPDIHGFSAAAPHLPSPLSASHCLPFPFLISLLHSLLATHPPLLPPKTLLFLVITISWSVFSRHMVIKIAQDSRAPLGGCFQQVCPITPPGAPAPAPGSHFRAAHLPWLLHFSLHPASASAKP